MSIKKELTEFQKILQTMKGIEIDGGKKSRRKAINVPHQRLQNEFKTIQETPEFYSGLRQGMEKSRSPFSRSVSRKKKHIQKYNQKINQTRKQHHIRKNKNQKKTKKYNIQRGGEAKDIKVKLLFRSSKKVVKIHFWSGSLNDVLRQYGLLQKLVKYGRKTNSIRLENFFVSEIDREKYHMFYFNENLQLSKQKYEEKKQEQIIIEFGKTPEAEEFNFGWDDSSHQYTSNPRLYNYLCGFNVNHMILIKLFDDSMEIVRQRLNPDTPITEEEIIDSTARTLDIGHIRRICVESLSKVKNASLNVVDFSERIQTISDSELRDKLLRLYMVYDKIKKKNTEMYDSLNPFKESDRGQFKITHQRIQMNETGEELERIDFKGEPISNIPPDIEQGESELIIKNEDQHVYLYVNTVSKVIICIISNKKKSKENQNFTNPAGLEDFFDYIYKSRPDIFHRGRYKERNLQIIQGDELYQATPQYQLPLLPPSYSPPQPERQSNIRTGTNNTRAAPYYNNSHNHQEVNLRQEINQTGVPRYENRYLQIDPQEEMRPNLGLDEDDARRGYIEVNEE